MTGVNDNDTLTGSGTARPTWSSSDSDLNSQPSAEFDGSNDHLDTGTTDLGGVDFWCPTSGGNPFTLIICGYWPSGVHSSTAGYVLARAGSTGGNRTFAVFLRGGSIRMYVRGQDTSFASVGTGLVYIVAVKYDGSSVSASANAQTSWESITTGSAAEETGENITIGCRTASSPNFELDGKIGEIIVFDSELSDANVNTICNDLESTHGGSWSDVS